MKSSKQSSIWGLLQQIHFLNKTGHVHIKLVKKKNEFPIFSINGTAKNTKRTEQVEREFQCQSISIQS